MDADCEFPIRGNMKKENFQRKDTARPAATQEHEQEKTEKTEA